MKKIFVCLGSLTCALVLTSCQVGENASSPDVGGELDIAGKLFPNIYVTIAQLIAFLVMVAIVFFFAYKPIKKNIEARKTHVENTINEAKDKLDNANVDKVQAAANLKESHVQAQKILDEAREAAVKNQTKIIEETREQLKIDAERQKQDLVNERKKMERDIHNEIVSTSLGVTKAILGREVNEDDNKAIIDSFIDKMNDEEK